MKVWRNLPYQPTGKATTMITLEDPVVDGGSVTVGIDATGEVSKFLAEERFTLACDVDLEGCPASILQIPAIVNLAPVAWAQGVSLEAASLEATFQRSMQQVRAGYAELHPAVFDEGPSGLEGPVETVEAPPGKRPAVLFSGGVDSTAAAVDLLDREPALVTVKGSDAGLDEETAWAGIRANAGAFAEEFDLEHRLMSSNLREVLNYRFLAAEFKPRLGRGWWGAIQYGTGLPALCAPLAYTERYGSVQLASGFTRDDTFPTAQPTFVDPLAWSGTQARIADPDTTRQTKIARLTRHLDDVGAFSVRSCLHSETGENCSACEKCYRTMVGLALAGADPALVGYEWGEAKMEEIHRAFAEREVQLSRTGAGFWEEMTADYRDGAGDRAPEGLDWLADLDPYVHAGEAKKPATHRAALAALRRAPYPLDATIDRALDRVA